MMTEEWTQILNILEKDLNPGLFKVWIKPLEAERRDGLVTLVAPNDFVADWVRDRYMEKVRSACCQGLGGAVEVKIKGRACSKPVSVGDGGDAPSLAVLATPRKPQVQARLPLRPQAPQVNNWRFSFDDFVVGPSNEMAHAASRSLCRSEFSADQLFLCSAPGLGKTHLLHAVGREMTRGANRSHVRVAYLTAEQFTTRLVSALKTKQMEMFKEVFRENVDVLLLEDIHFLQGKPRIQDELLATIKALKDKGCRVLFTSSFLPKELDGVDSRLVSRLCSGFMTVIEKPDLETRIAILRAKARALSVSVPREISGLLAEHITTDIRQLESCLQNLVLKAKLLKMPITAEIALQVLENYGVEHSGYDMDRIIDFVCKSFELNLNQLKSKSRKRHLVQARNTAFYLARQHTSMSLKDIGRQLGRRHSTVLKGITNVEREISMQTPLGRQLESVIDRLD